jgi:hypothetical protein
MDIINLDMTNYDIRRLSEMYIVFGVVSFMTCMICIFVNARRRIRNNRQIHIRRQYTV